RMEQIICIFVYSKMSLMEFIFTKPKDKILGEHIKVYYILDKRTKTPSRYFTFTNNYTILSFLFNASVEKSGDKIKIFETPGKSTLSFSTNYVRLWEVHYLDKVDEVTIYFKPFGIHHFFDDGGVFIKEENVLGFKTGDSLKNDLQFIVENYNDVGNNLERYFSLRFVKKKDELLQNILQELDGNDTVENIAAKLGISLQYLTKYFKKQM